MKLLWMLATLTLPAFAESPVRVTVDAAPHRALVLEVTVPAPLGAVWEAFATSEGLSTWLTPGAVVDLRQGGEWTAHYPGGRTGGGTILDFLPLREMILSAMAPEQFPTVRAERTIAIFQFRSSEDGSTIVRLTQTGWRQGDEWNTAYEYLARGNAQLLETLRRRFVSGPIDWAKEWGGAK